FVFERRGLSGILSMPDNRPDSDRPSEPERPDAVPVIASAGPGRSDDPSDPSFPSFADRLAFGGMRDPSTLHDPGPRDYCGFEVPTLGYTADPRFGGMLGASMLQLPGE